MSGEPQKLITVEDHDAAIDRLTKRRNLLADPREQENRRIRREQLAGQWAVTLALRENHLQAIRELAGEDAWLFDSLELQSDGWVKNHEGHWTLPPRQSPSEGAGPSL